MIAFVLTTPELMVPYKLKPCQLCAPSEKRGRKNMGKRPLLDNLGWMDLGRSPGLTLQPNQGKIGEEKRRKMAWNF